MKTIKYTALLLLLAACSSPTTSTGPTTGKLASFEGKWLCVEQTPAIDTGNILTVGDSAGTLTATWYHARAATLYPGQVSRSWDTLAVGLVYRFSFIAANYSMDSGFFGESIPGYNTLVCDWTPDTLYMNRRVGTPAIFVRQ